MASRGRPSAAPPPSYAMISRVYNHSLRPVLIVSTILAIAYCALWGGAALNDIHDDKPINSKLSLLDLVVGVIYLAIIAVELLGLYSGATQKATVVRVFAYATLLVALAVMAAEILRVVMHFAFKDSIINYCTVQVQKDPSACEGNFCDGQSLDAADAQNYCRAQWNRSSFSDVAWFIVASIFAWVFSSIAFGYLHQLLSVGIRVNQDNDRIQLQTYNPPTVPYEQQQPHTPRFEPPNYPPPEDDMEVGKAPAYDKGGYEGFYAEKAPGYDVAVTAAGSESFAPPLSSGQVAEEHPGAHGPRREPDNNPFRVS